MTIQEHNPAPNNPLGMDGIEFIEYATLQPSAFGMLLEQIGFVAIARHRSREVTLYRQGGMNVIVNADRDAFQNGDKDIQTTCISAIALRVRDADVAYKHAIAMGAWAIQTRAGVMELNIPGIHGAGDSLLYFVDRFSDFSIYDVDFKPIPHVPNNPPAITGLEFFGVVQAIERGRSAEWIDFYRQLMDFRPLPEGHYFGILPKGTLLESPCHSFYLQLIEPPAENLDMHWDEQLLRVGFGTPDVLNTVRTLKERGIVFVDREQVQASEKGALTQIYKGGVSFELVVLKDENA